MGILKVLVYFSAVSFVYYGVTCLFSKNMVSEFRRFGVSPWQRVMTGILQVAGALGLIIGIIFPLLGFIAASGLAALMLLGFVIRMKIRDGLFQSLPSFTYLVINLYISYSFYLML